MRAFDVRSINLVIFFFGHIYTDNKRNGHAISHFTLTFVMNIETFVVFCHTIDPFSQWVSSVKLNLIYLFVAARMCIDMVQIKDIYSFSWSGDLCKCFKLSFSVVTLQPLTFWILSFEFTPTNRKKYCIAVMQNDKKKCWNSLRFVWLFELKKINWKCKQLLITF